MKHTIFILALITASIQTFAQSPRIKLNQITKDSLTGSVLISSPIDSGMVYSRDLFISYGADTFLILGGDTIVLQSDLIAEIGDSLLNYVSRTELSDSLTFYVSRTELSDSTLNIRTDIPLIIADSLLNYVNITGTQTITGAKTFSTAIVVNEDGNNVDTRIEGDTEPNLLFVDASTNRVGIGTSSPTAKLNVDDSEVHLSGVEGGIRRTGNQDLILFSASSGKGLYVYTNNDGGSPKMVVAGSGYVGIGKTSPSYPLEMGSGAHVTIGGVWTDASDIKLKTNINYIYPYGLEDIMNLKPTIFDYKNGEKNSLGFIAQDIYEIIPEAISSTIDDNGNETMGLKMVSITATLTKAIQEQQAIIESQATEIEQLKTQIELILSEIEQIKNN